MRRRVFILISAAALAAACSRQQQPEGKEAPSQDFPDPVEIVRPLYDRYMSDNATFPSLLEQAPWSQTMRAALEAMMARSIAEQAPILDFDPFVNAQDYQISTVTVTTQAVVVNSHAVVGVAFVNAGTQDGVVYDLVWEGEAWKVDNIRHQGWELRQIAQGGPS